MLREPDRLLAKPLISEPAIESDPDIDLRRANCRVGVEERPSDPLRGLLSPLV